MKTVAYIRYSRYIGFYSRPPAQVDLATAPDERRVVLQLCLKECKKFGLVPTAPKPRATRSELYPYTMVTPWEAVTIDINLGAELPAPTASAGKWRPNV